MGDIVPIRRGRPEDPETLRDFFDEVKAREDEWLSTVAAARPLVRQLVTYGMNAHPLVLARARVLERLLDHAERRTLGGAA